MSSDLKIFESLKDFINEYSTISNVHLNNYRTIFFCYFGILSFISVLFIFHHIYKFIFRKLMISNFFHLATKNRFKREDKKIYEIPKRAKTSRPIYKSCIVVQNGLYELNL